MMENHYQIHSPAARRSSQSVTMAPAATMIDPSLENHRMTNPQLSHDYNTSQIQRNSTMQLGNHHDHASDRVMPSREVNDDSLDEAYVNFILYCNPSISADVDTTELRKGFRSPPKSDGKSFSPFVLFGLISKLEAKEIKTWTQLVTELGVEQPDTAKNQSTQKVQQYAVRLKRWLHAFHVDAFFQYCLNVPNTYYTERPASTEPLAESIRDGVQPEEDLALRALLPEWRPKRGRRKAEDTENENSANKRIQFRRSASPNFFNFDEHYSSHPQSAVTWSAHLQQDGWSGAEVAIAPKAHNPTSTTGLHQLNAQPVSAGNHLRWRVNDSVTTPSSPYPHSAVITRNNYATTAFDEPQSANPGGSSPSVRSRKRHGPAISSAWPGSTSTSTGKLRGRPPSNRSVQDGPFSTFPANPNTKEAPTIISATPTTQNANSPSPNHSHSAQNQGSTPSSQVKSTPPTTGSSRSPMAMATSLPDQPSLVRKPSKLQLQVPEHSGGPVRLATPPRLLINGESDRHGQSINNPQQQERRSSADFFETVDDGSGDDAMGDEDEDIVGGGGNVDWRRRAMILKKKLAEKEEELRALKRRVLEAVM